MRHQPFGWVEYLAGDPGINGLLHLFSTVRYLADRQTTRVRNRQCWRVPVVKPRVSHRGTSLPAQGPESSMPVNRGTGYCKN
ncbi:hypothetical protein D3C86_1199270 [compost metagenome]